MKKMCLDEIGSLDVDGSAEYIIEQLKPFVELYGANKVSCSIEEYPYSNGDKYIAIFRSREETDEEYQKRTEEETKYKKIRDENERRQYEELSKKFGKK